MENQIAHYAALAGLLHDAALRDSLSEFVPADWQKSLNQIPKEILILADQLSAGSTSRPINDANQRGQSHLLSIFSLIQIEEGGKIQGVASNHYWPLKLLSVHDQNSLFPIPAQEISEANSQQAKEKLLIELRNQMHSLKQAHEKESNEEVYLESLLHLLQRYTWCIPSNCYRDMPALSLYDHSRMTAALAALLRESRFSTEELQVIADAPEKSDNEIALLVGGDISGVQDFIYTITNKGATSALRGRSFYLQLLTEAVARFVLRELQLPITNMVYAGGGNFYILARPDDVGILKRVRRDISRILFKHHRGDLYLAVEAVSVQVKEFMPPPVKNKPHPLSDKWGAVARELAKAKNHRFSELETLEFKKLFQPEGHGGNEDMECMVCGREHPQTTIWKIPKEGQEPVRECSPCHSYEVLGDKLRDAQYIAWRSLADSQNAELSKADDKPGEWDKVLKELGFNVPLPFMDFMDAPREGLIWALNDEAFNKAKFDKNRIVARRFLVNVTPRLKEEFIDSAGVMFEQGNIKPFEMMADESAGIKRLGILRMDVDNLGRVFAQGLGEHGTLSLIASLSFAISLYFEGWVGRLAQKRNNENGDKLYAIYSGGDDLFFVGSWDQVIELAHEIHEDLKEYAAHHPGIHTSGGVVLAQDKYPLAKAAEDAARAEEQAKKYEWWDENGKHSKNVISFLGQPLSWSMFEQARSLMKRISRDVETTKRKSFIRTLLINYAQYAKNMKIHRLQGKDKNKQNKPQILYGPWNWRIFYTLKRNRANESLTNEIHDNPAMLEWLGVAARWAELKNRKSD